ncbi:hypothetical protein ACP8HI_12465 [Paenibacillus sp. FA6]|uniref:hypothetical protein n=1 Tax=Paenibacillus sp. FA6 TaxID=3413029 RepID=UPI003F656514
MSLNQWVIDNSTLVGFINIMLTVLLTALNVWFARNSQKYSAHSLKQSERVRKENNTPNITAHFEFENGLYYFHVNNFGVNAAKDILIEFTPINEVKELAHLNRSALINKTIGFLAPGQNINTYAGSYQELLNSTKELPIIETKIQYNDLDNNSYERNYVLDINIFKGNIYRKEKSLTDLTNQVKEVDKTLSHIESLFHIYIDEFKKSNINKKRFRGR